MNLIALNKPFGTICQFSAHETRPSLGDWVKTLKTAREEAIAALKS